MGGAFVAVASDATATWWNPAALAAGPFVDVAVGTTGKRSLGFALMTPPAGVSLYRFRVTDIATAGSIDAASGDREKRRVGVPVSPFMASQLGVTVLHSVASGVHVGTTFKYVRGNADNAFDLDLGVLAATGAIRAGALVRHLGEPDLGIGAARVELPRQARLGIAYDGEAIGQSPLFVSMDADVTRLTTPRGDRRVVAFGVERWVRGKSLGLRGGGRFNTVGREEKVATAGASLALKSGLYVEGYGARGGASDDQGWGVGARVTF